jgi:hypothetical protein
VRRPLERALARLLPKNPLFQLELQRTRRKRWWPGRRFFLFYPVVLGVALGYGVVLALARSLETQLGIAVTAVPGICLLSVITWLLSVALPWIAPALTAAAIARERELQTFDLLRTTLLTERGIVLGKLGSCVVRLWPGILMLALLAPFQAIQTSTSGLGSLYIPALMAGTEYNVVGMGALLLLMGLVTALKSFGDLALHATVGLFVSAFARSSGIAVAVSYGVILAARVFLWIAASVSTSLLTMGLVDQVVSTDFMASLEYMMLIPSVLSLVTVVAEFLGAVLLVWGTIWRLRRL